MLEEMNAKDLNLAKYFNPNKEDPLIQDKLKIVMRRFKMVKLELVEIK